MANDPVSLLLANVVGPSDHWCTQLEAGCGTPLHGWCSGSAVSDAHLFVVEGSVAKIYYKQS